MSDVLNEPWLQERPYVQGFALVLGLGMAQELSYAQPEQPFYFGPLQDFEDRLRKAKLVPPPPSWAASIGTEQMLTRVRRSEADLAESYQDLA